MPYNMYRITVEKLTPNGHTMRQVEIVLTSDYTLLDDLTEWVKTEIDPDASVTATEFDPMEVPELKPITTFPRELNPEAWHGFNWPPNDGRDREKCPVTKSAHVRRAGWKDGKEIEFCNECGTVLRTIDTP